MTQLTMGQRIASRRKLLNLSQEALSEQLNVSRQAVSKWESDAAIPEIDKLIALGRIFGVSVGWLLGTETDADFNPRDYFTDAQMEMMEQIIARCHPKPNRWKLPAVIACIAAVIAGFWLYTSTQMELLAADNAATQAQMSQLMEDNRSLQTQINEMNALLEKHNETEKLLDGYGAVPIASEDLSTINMQFLFYPKLHQENCTAYLSIENPTAGVNEMLECSWQYDHYVLRTELPPADGYRYAFLLVSETGYEQQLLDDAELVPLDLDSGMNFHLHRDDPKRAQLEQNISAPWDLSETTYTYQNPIYTPLILPISRGYVPFRDIVITLRLNDTAVWESSYYDAFKAHTDGIFRSAEPLFPDIAVDLPELAEGDRLTLEITGVSYTGLTYYTLLDDRTVMKPAP